MVRGINERASSRHSSILCYAADSTPIPPQLSTTLSWSGAEMRALLEDMKSGRVAVYDVPAPELKEGGILVRTAFSAISSGTEKATVQAGRKSLLGKAMARPDLVKQVLAYAQSNGIAAARQKVQARLETLAALGYSCSGLVLEVGAAVTGFQPGDRVACAGAGYASHCK